MRAHITVTAWVMGFRNALICGVVFLLLWLALSAAISLAPGQAIGDSAFLVFAALSGAALLGFLGTWLFSRRSGGRVLLDCGPHLMRPLFLLNALVFLVIGLTGTSATSLCPAGWGIAGSVFAVLFGVYWLIMATGRLQVREDGIWAYWSLLRWNKVRFYAWADDQTLTIEAKSVLPFLGRGGLLVPRECQQGVDDLLQRYCPGQRRSADWSWKGLQAYSGMGRNEIVEDVKRLLRSLYTSRRDE